jgi:hypothetical protein
MVSNSTAKLTAAFLGVCFKEHRIHINAETTGLGVLLLYQTYRKKDFLKVPDNGSFNAGTLFLALAISSGIFILHKDSKLK